MAEVNVRVDSCLFAEDGSHVVVNAMLPDGSRVVDAHIAPIPNSPAELAKALIASSAPRYRVVPLFTGNIKVDDTPVAAPAAPAAPEAPAAPAPAEAPAEDASEAKAVGVGDGAKGKSK